MYSSTLSLTSALNEVGDQRHALVALPLGKRPGTQCIEGWVGPRAGLNGCGKCPSSLPEFDPPDLPARSEMLYRQTYGEPPSKIVQIHNDSELL